MAEDDWERKIAAVEDVVGELTPPRLSQLSASQLSRKMPKLAESYQELPVEVATQVDKALAEDGWMSATWHGRNIVVVSDTYLARLAGTRGEALRTAAEGAWVLERGDGRKAYVWSAPGGSYGTGKASI